MNQPHRNIYGFDSAAQANTHAALVAAAPGLLELAEQLAGLLENPHLQFKGIDRAALLSDTHAIIAKARGTFRF